MHRMSVLNFEKVFVDKQDSDCKNWEVRMSVQPRCILPWGNSFHSYVGMRWVHCLSKAKIWWASQDRWESHQLQCCLWCPVLLENQSIFSRAAPSGTDNRDYDVNDGHYSANDTHYNVNISRYSVTDSVAMIIKLIKLLKIMIINAHFVPSG